MRSALYIIGILDDTDLVWLAAKGARRTLAEGVAIVHEGVPSDSLFLLLDGELVVRTEGAGEVARLQVGDVIGEVSFVDSRPPTATVAAVRPSIALAVPRELLRDKLQTDQGFASRFYRSLAIFLADRLRSTMSRLSSYTEDSAEEMNDEMMDHTSLAAARFDRFLRSGGVGGPT
jgi:CRP/FNR family transcriptional regulator, cyclic AMP receptor protein